MLPTKAADTDSTRTTLATSYGRYAHAHVTGTKISYSYSAGTGKVNSTYAFTTEAKEGTETKTVVSLYPHQWKDLAGGSPISQTYVSPRGQMKNLVGVSSFATSMTYHGILPELPAVATSAGADRATLINYLNQVADDPAGEQKPDTYWAGKGLGRSARIAEIADLVGETATRDKALTAMKRTLENWLTASSGENDHLFYYDQNWGTLIGYDASYGSDQELNDHHFHYGYFIAAAATVAKFDPNWAKSSQYGGMIDLLIRDANNYDRDDNRFPYLRDFDIYAGHDWASGHGVVRLGQQPGVQLGGDELRRRPDPVGPGDRQHRRPRRRHLHLHDPGCGDRGLLVRRRQRRVPGPVPAQHGRHGVGRRRRVRHLVHRRSRRRSRASTSCRSPAATSTWVCTRPTTRSTTTRWSATAAANPPPGRTSCGSSSLSAIPIWR